MAGQDHRPSWWGAPAPYVGRELCNDFDATITLAHGEGQPRRNLEETFGFHTLLVFPATSGEASAGLLHPGQRRQ